MNRANARWSAARCVARALARNTRCRRRIAVGAVGKGLGHGTSRLLERAVRPAAASARLKRINRKTEFRGSGRRVRLEEQQQYQAISRVPRARGPCAYAQRQVPRSVWAPAMRPAPPTLVCFAVQMRTQMQVQGQSKTAPRWAWPNPSIEGTANGGARLRASPPPMAPLSAPHVKR
jgi:hypothetical protein